MRRAKRGMGIKDVPTKVNAGWRKRIRERLKEFQYTGHGRQFLREHETMSKKLLELGGAVVSPQYHGPKAIRIIRSLGYIQDLPVRMAPAKWVHIGQCHTNAAAMWESWNQGGVKGGPYAIGTGYSLSDDGMWRPHSWIVDEGKGCIIETCSKRVAYFGAVLSFTKSKEFAEAELGPI